MIGILFGVLVLAGSVLVAGVRMFRGPNDANRAIAQVIQPARRHAEEARPRSEGDVLGGGERYLFGAILVRCMHQ